MVTNIILEVHTVGRVFMCTVQVKRIAESSMKRIEEKETMIIILERRNTYTRREIGNVLTRSAVTKILQSVQFAIYVKLQSRRTNQITALGQGQNQDQGTQETQGVHDQGQEIENREDISSEDIEMQIDPHQDPDLDLDQGLNIQGLSPGQDLVQIETPIREDTEALIIKQVFLKMAIGNATVVII